MKLLRNLILSPLSFVRLFVVVFISGYVTVIGWFWYKLFGFSRGLQKWVTRCWGRTILFTCGIKIDRNALPENSNYILMPNHRSYLDIFIVAGLTSTAMVGKAELKKWPFAALGAKITNSILVDRKNSSSLINTMNQIKDSVSKGMPVTLFPEGTTYKGPLTKSFKKGSFKIAADSGIPVVPMAIHYKDINDAWIDDDTFIGHFFRQMGKLQTRVTVRYGEPLTASDYKILRDKTKSEIEVMLKEIQQG